MTRLAEITNSSAVFSRPIDFGATLLRRGDAETLRRVRDNLYVVRKNLGESAVKEFDIRDPDSRDKHRRPAFRLMTPPDSNVFPESLDGVPLQKLAEAVLEDVPSVNEELPMSVRVAIPRFKKGNRYAVIKPDEEAEYRLQQERRGLGLVLGKLANVGYVELPDQPLDMTAAFIKFPGCEDLPEVVREPVFDAIHDGLKSPDGLLEVTLLPGEWDNTGW